MPLVPLLELKSGLCCIQGSKRVFVHLRHSVSFQVPQCHFQVTLTSLDVSR